MRRLLVLVLLLAACNQDFDPADRRAALQDEYELDDQSCETATNQVGDRVAGVAVARGTLANRTDDAEGFSVTVRFFDGDIDLGNTIVNHPELMEPGESWDWEAGIEIDEVPTDLRCNVIQVAIGQDVDH